MVKLKCNPLIKENNQKGNFAATVFIMEEKIEKIRANAALHLP